MMVPKKEEAMEVTDFRPISIINLLPELISKVMALRLSKELPELISSHQMTFIRGRFIAENFIATRELLHHVAALRNPIVFTKIDFSKAFDTISWVFLRRLMIARGFPDDWIRWTDNLLSSASSRVIVNGEYTAYFQHKRG